MAGGKFTKLVTGVLAAPASAQMAAPKIDETPLPSSGLTIFQATAGNGNQDSMQIHCDGPGSSMVLTEQLPSGKRAAHAFTVQGVENTEVTGGFSLDGGSGSSKAGPALDPAQEKALAPGNFCTGKKLDAAKAKAAFSAFLTPH
jgi:hypothetical protein